MGCASSKQKRCRHCQSPYSPVPRSYSMHVHHPPQGKGDSYHVVALQSTTLGSLKLDFKSQNQTNHNHNHQVGNINGCDADNDQDHQDDDGDHKTGGDGGGDHCNGVEDKGNEFNMGLVEAKLWSNMIQQKIPKVVPKTPIRTPPGEPETINTWELMEGLEDVSPHRSPNHFRSFSFNFARNERTNPNPNLNPVVVSAVDRPKSRLSENGTVWLQMEESFVSEFDPEVISSFRKSMEELSPGHPFHLRPLDCDKQQQQPALVVAGSDMSLDTFDAKKSNNNNGEVVFDHNKLRKEKVVVYFTSLRGVRKTYEDCCHVRVILKSLGVRIDERDVSMHSGFKEELKELLGDGFYQGGLPRVFIGRDYIGGADDIRRLHEEGDLEKLVDKCQRVDDGNAGGGLAGGNGGPCEACGDMRFVPCETCSGSCKIYYEEEEEEEEEEWGGHESEFGFHRCPDCNENGLIRCPICCY